jgi:zinc/manganese transport system ATP-binding protein
MPGSERQQRYGMSVVSLARTAAAPVRRMSRSSANALGKFGQTVLTRCFDPGYDPDAASRVRDERTDTAIEVRDLTVRYGGRIALEHLTGTFAAGSLTAVVGPNGAGKSTLLKALAGIVRTRRSAVAGMERRHRVAYLPQRTALGLDFPVSVREFVALGGWRRLGAFRGASSDYPALVAEATASVGLDGLTGRRVADLSIGQFQRVLFARMLMQDANVLLLDEPFAAVDERTSEDLLRLLGQWHREGRTVIAVLHDLAQVREHFPTSLVLARRAIGWGETAAVLTQANFALARATLDGAPL